MEIMQTLYNLLQVNLKIEDQHTRYLYLKDVWGLEQIVIGQLEGVSQSQVSKVLLVARKEISFDELWERTNILWTGDEIKYIQMLPREILPDIPAIAFINNILGIYPNHGFFDYLDTAINARIVGAAWLGVMNKRLIEIFGKNQSTISMLVKRSIDRIPDIKRAARYEQVTEYRFKPQVRPQKPFTVTGGMN